MQSRSRPRKGAPVGGIERLIHGLGKAETSQCLRSPDEFGSAAKKIQYLELVADPAAKTSPSRRGIETGTGKGHLLENIETPWFDPLPQ
ncbi:MAG: hypothetical protein E5W17_02750, partial [Mesorhizobium sp.]